MGSLHFDDQQFNAMSLSDTPLELHNVISAYGEGALDGMWCNTTTDGINIPPKHLASKHAQQHNTKKLKLKVKVKRGGVKKKANLKSNKRPSHWRREALRRIFAGVYHACTNM